MDIVVKKVLVVTQEFLGLLGNLATQVKVGILVQKESQDIQEFLVPRDTPALKAYQDIRELMDKHQLLDIQELAVILEMRGCPDTQVIMDTQGLKVYQAIQELKDYQVTQESQVIQELKDYQVTQGMWEHRVTLGSKEALAILESKELKEKVAIRVYLDIQEDQDIQEWLVFLVTRVSKESQDTQVRRE